MKLKNGRARPGGARAATQGDITGLPPQIADPTHAPPAKRFVSAVVVRTVPAWTPPGGGHACMHDCTLRRVTNAHKHNHSLEMNTPTNQCRRAVKIEVSCHILNDGRDR